MDKILSLNQIQNKRSLHPFCSHLHRTCNEKYWKQSNNNCVIIVIQLNKNYVFSIAKKKEEIIGFDQYYFDLVITVSPMWIIGGIISTLLRSNKFDHLDEEIEYIKN